MNARFSRAFSIEDTYEPLIVFEILTIEKKPSILPLQTHVTVLENLGSSSDISLVVFSWQTIVVVAASVVVYSMFFSV
ncbi:dolichyl-diphosphooligosaccharide--protein glycosyltransferase subunit [Trifolium repens]|nr:dolichyl-diphosphooligosaccharide--protein glycosyltransferase subunit [Trifolium repens]